MGFTVFLGNLPAWVTADDIKQWLAAEDLVADAVKVIRNHETQEPTADEMQSIIRRFDRAPLEDRLLRANPAQPPKGKDVRGPQQASAAPTPQPAPANGARLQRPDRKRRGGGKDREQSPRSAFAAELAKVL